jgi:predicted lipoprotein
VSASSDRLRVIITGMVIICAIAFATTCTVSLGDGERRITAQDLTAEVIVPTLDEAVARAAALTIAIQALANAPGAAELDAAQAAWRGARIPWKHADAFRFGPAKDLSLTAAIDQAIEASKVDLEVAGTAAISEAYIETIGANRKGFHAIEYLAFRGDDDAAILASLTTDPLAPRRRELLVAYAQNLERKVRELRDAWTLDYAARLTQPGSANMTYPTIKSVIDTLANESVFQSEFLADTRIGKPMGTATGGLPQPDLEESGPSDNSIVDLADALRGIRNIYFGSLDGVPGKGIGRLVAAASPSTDLEVRATLAAAIAAVEAIPRPFRTALVELRPEVLAAHEAVKELKRLFATEVIGILGATLKFNDNDGD